MTFALTGRVVRHVGAFAVVQLDGGLLPIRDEHRTLVSGVGALVTIAPLDDDAAHCDALDACAAFTVHQDGPVGLLSDPCGGQPVALLLSQPWPASALVRVSTPSPELDEGAAEAEPFGSSSPTPRIR